MAARRRLRIELFEEYRINLKREAYVEKIKLAGKWVWRSFILTPDDPKLTAKQNASLGKIIKLPPYRKPIIEEAQ